MIPQTQATSPYDPGRIHHPNRSATSTTAVIAIFLFVIHYWTRNREDRKRLRPERLWEFFSGTGPGRSFINHVQSLRLINPKICNLLRSILNTLMPSPKGTGSAASSILSPSNGANGDITGRREIRKHQRSIHSVLGYWFGQHTPEKSQKMLWMIAASSREYRETIDAEIASKFEDLLRDLSSNPSTRNTSDTNEEQSTPKLWDEWCLDPDGIYGARGKIAAIIVLDQFSRHILRHYETNRPSEPLPTKEALDRRALATAKLLVQHHATELDCGMIPLPMRVFALMPYRHAGTMESVKYVQQAIEEMASLEEQNVAMVGRFRKATNRRLAVLQDEQRRTGTTADGHGNKNDGKPDDTETKGPLQFSDNDILETFPFEADMSPSLQHPIHKTMVEFLADQGIHPSNSGPENGKKGRLPTEIPASPKQAAIIVSLSGGVDSMVIASVLSHLKDSCGYGHLTILAVHIDYANRPESGAEADYVERYCKTQLKSDIEFSCRRIGEVTRGITARDDYERIAREIRYGSYREAVARAKDLMGLSSKEEREKTIVGVMLGHHRGDLRENVLSNAHKGCGPLDLSGMTAVSKNDGITLYRPLLPLEKSFVFDYAHKFGVPYYKDTTPHWSTRGKLRNKLLPLLEEIYGDGSMNNLSNLAVESDECRSLMNKSMIEPFLQSIVRKPMGIVFDTASWKDQPLFFWKVVLREALHSIGLGMFSDKSVTAFLERITAKKLKAAWLQCRKDYGVYLQEDGKVFVLYPSSFPWSKKDAYKLDGQSLDFDTERVVGPWNVKSEVIPETLMNGSSQPPETWLAKKAVLSMEAFMDGDIEYYLKTPTLWSEASKAYLPRALIFRNFSKADRPRAWKNCNLRIQSTLPVLGIDNSIGEGSTNDSNGKRDVNPEQLIRVSISLRACNGDQ